MHTRLEHLCGFAQGVDFDEGHPLLQLDLVQTSTCSASCVGTIDIASGALSSSSGIRGRGRGNRRLLGAPSARLQPQKRLENVQLTSDRVAADCCAGLRARGAGCHRLIRPPPGT